uniref:Dual specificity phosphatase 23 n=1 Tax=Rousettus aegyptiacus TaxID=9407 RepID=A0A7J8BDS7_ROUAE|nr:dual specificity phosphatase 23 [Rousettus aegyptiacus]
MGVQPPNFSWVLPGRLAGLALPRLPAHYQFLLDQGVRHLVSLTERGPPHNDSCPGLTLHRLRIPDFCPPAPEQIDRFMQIVNEANARGELQPCRATCSRTKLETTQVRAVGKRMLEENTSVNTFSLAHQLFEDYFVSLLYLIFLRRIIRDIHTADEENLSDRHCLPSLHLKML